MKMALLTLFVILFNCHQASAANSDSLLISGKAQFWISTIKAEQPGLPQPKGDAQTLVTEIKRPDFAGYVSQEVLETSVAGLKAKIRFVWKRPLDGEDYIATQIELYTSEGKLLALCSRYQSLVQIEPLPVGACAARNGDSMVGISLLRNNY